MVALALGSSVYIWNAETHTVVGSLEPDPLSGQESISSLCWSEDGRALCVGTRRGEIQVWNFRANGNIFGGGGSCWFVVTWGLLFWSCGTLTASAWWDVCYRMSQWSELFPGNGPFSAGMFWLCICRKIAHTKKCPYFGTQYVASTNTHTERHTHNVLFFTMIFICWAAIATHWSMSKGHTVSTLSVDLLLEVSFTKTFVLLHL